MKNGSATSPTAKLVLGLFCLALGGAYFHFGSTVGVEIADRSAMLPLPASDVEDWGYDARLEPKTWLSHNGRGTVDGELSWLTAEDLSPGEMLDHIHELSREG